MNIDLNTFFQNNSLLYAEDEPVAQALYEDYFKKYFKNIYTANDGQKALEIYTQERPDVVILDINMPVLSGLDVCKAIRKTDSKTRIILLTIRTDKEAFLKAVELGLTTYLEKPVKRDKLDQSLLKLATEMYYENQIIICKVDTDMYVWNKGKRELFCNSDVIVLTKKEKLLLELLVSTHHDKVSYEQIYKVVWLEDYNMQNYNELSIKTLIKKLRAKLPSKLIKNAYGLGYYLDKSQLI